MSVCDRAAADPDPDPHRDEAARLAELHALTDPDAPQGADVEDLVLRAAQVAGVAMATVNLFDAERQCQVATAGFTGAATPRREAMCSVVLEHGAFVHVPDARHDDRFADSPWVDGRRGEVRFYASAPLVTARGLVIGTLCVFDVEPHALTPGQVAELEQLAADVVAAYERGRTTRR